MKLRYQILLLVLLPLLVTNVIYLYQTNQLLQRLEDSIQQRLQTKSVAVKNDLNHHFQMDAEISGALSTSLDIAAALEIGDTDFLFNKAKLFIGPSIKYITFVNNKGMVMARGHDEFRFGDILNINALAVSKKNNITLGTHEDRICFLTFQPILNPNSEPVGSVIAGCPLSCVLDRLSRQYLIQLTASRDGKRLGASYNNFSVLQWDRKTIDVNAGNDLFQLTLLEDNRKERSALVQLRQKLFNFISIFSIILILVILFFVRQLVRPVKLLSEKMRKYSSVQVVEDLPEPKNEIGGLVAAFKQMSAALFKHKQSLERSNQELQVEITHRKEAQNALAQTNVTLEEKVKFRTKELTRSNEQLQQALIDREQAEKKLRRIQKMETIALIAGGIAHDFNNILYIVIGNTELAKDELPEESPIQEYLKQINTAGLKGAGIVKQLLNYSRHTELKLTPVKTILMIKNTIDFLESTIPPSIELHTYIPETASTILGDATQINQAILNLCMNAVQTMEKSGGILKVTIEEVTLVQTPPHAHPQLEKGRYIKITVSDTGPGIKPDMIDKIFDPYFTTKPPGEGSGMGLTVVHGIVKNHRGSVSVTNRKEKGAVFTLFFPVSLEQGRT